ncbi:MAG: hypothetical protein ACRDQ5_15790, partial [Sciscionella sp.]
MQEKTTNQHAPSTSEPATRRRIRLACAVVSGTILIAGHLLTLLFTAFGWWMTPSGPGDPNLIEGAWFTAFTGTVLALCTGLLTLPALRARWLGTRWLLVPVVLFVVATVRWVSIGLAYDL